MILYFLLFCCISAQEDLYKEPDSGNWYEKLHWWKEAQKVYNEDVQNALEQIATVEEDFKQRTTTLSEQHAAAMKALPTRKAEAAPLIAKELKRIEEDLELPKATQEEKAALEGLQKKLESLNTDFDQLVTLEQRFQEALTQTFSRQVAQTKRYAEQAKEAFEKIEKVLDERKARKYYKQVENSLENMRAATTYLIGPLQIFIDQSWTKLTQIMGRITETIQALEQEGILLRPYTEEEKAAEERARQEQAKKKAEEARKKAEQSRSWWQRFTDSLGSFFSSIGHSISNFFSWVGSFFIKKVK